MQSNVRVDDVARQAKGASTVTYDSFSLICHCGGPGIMKLQIRSVDLGLPLTPASSDVNPHEILILFGTFFTHYSCAKR